MSLRDEAITHMAQAINDMIAINIGGELGQVPDAHRGKEAAAALDALLDFLDAHIEEWEEGADVEFESSVRLVDAFRGTTEEQ